MKIFLMVLWLCLIVSLSYAGDRQFETPKDLTPLQAHGIRDGQEMDVNATYQKITWYYYLLDSAGQVIRYPRAKQPFKCQNWDAVPGVSNADCIALDDPDACCTDVGVGTCDDTFDNANCIARGDPLECCTGPAEGSCSCWDDIKSSFISIKNYFEQEVEEWLGVTVTP